MLPAMGQSDMSLSKYMPCIVQDYMHLDWVVGLHMHIVSYRVAIPSADLYELDVADEFARGGLRVLLVGVATESPLVVTAERVDVTVH